MHNDDMDQNKTHGNNDQQKPRKAPRASHQNEEEYVQTRSRDKQRTTAIALSVITCLFMCVIGYEIVHENTSKHENHQISYEPAKPSLSLSKLNMHSNSDLLADESDEDSYENHQIRLLQEQNKRQANKIKSLRQDLLEKMQAIHDIKANLFKQEGDPRDKVKIVDLNQKLEERENTTNKLTADMKTLEAELAILQRKIEHSEVTRDALTLMIENQRSAKEQEHVAAQKQIAELQHSKVEELANLKENLSQLQQSIAQKEIAHQEKLDTLEKLNKDLAEQRQLHSEKMAEHESLASVFQTTTKTLNQQILDLITGLEWEATSKANETQNLQTALEQHKLEKSSVVNVLETELQKRNGIIASQEITINTHRNELGLTVNESKEQILNLIATLELEMTRASFLQQNLDRAIYVNQQKLDDKANSVHSLESDLKKQKILLESKAEELSNLMSVLALTREEHHERISDLVASYELESTKMQVLRKDLLANNQEQTSVKITELTKEIEERDSLLAIREFELRELMALQGKNAYNQHWQVAELSNHIEAGYLQTTHLHENLQDLTLHNQKLQGDVERVGELELAIANLREALEQKEWLLAKKQEQLENQIQSNDITDQDLRTHTQHLTQALEIENRLKAQIADLSNSLDNKTAQLAELEVKLQKATESTEELSKNHEELLSRSLETEEYLRGRIDDLSDAHNYKSAEYSNLEAELERAKVATAELSQQHDQHLSNALENESQLKIQIDDLSSTLEGKIAQLSKLEAELERTTQAAYELSGRHDQNLAHALKTENELKAQISELSEVLESKTDHLNALATELEQSRHAANDLSRIHEQHLSAALDIENEYKSQISDLSGKHNQHLSVNLEAKNELREQINELSEALESKTAQLNHLETELEQSRYAANDLSRRHEQYLSAALDTENEYKSQISDLSGRHNQHLSAALETENELREQINELSKALESKTAQLSDLEDQLQESAYQSDSITKKHDYIRSLASENEKVLKREINELSNALENEAEKLVSLEAELKNLLQSNINGEKYASDVENQLRQIAEKAASLELEVNSHHYSLAQKEQEIESILSSKNELEISLNEQIDELHAQMAHEQNKAALIETKYKERKADHAELAKQLQSFELDIGALNTQLLEKQKELLATEEKLLLALPQLDLLTNENNHLHDSRTNLENKLNEITELFHTQQRQFQDQNQQLAQEQAFFQKVQSDQDEQKRVAQQALKKLEQANFRTALLEDQLKFNQSALLQHENAVSELRQNQTALKEEHESLINSLKNELANQKKKAVQAEKNNEQALANLKEHQDLISDLQETLNQRNDSAGDVDSEIRLLKEELTKTNEQLRQKTVNENIVAELQKKLEDEKEKRQTFEDDLEKAILSYNNAKTNLENEREKNKTIEADLKKVISSYNAEKRKQRNTAERQPHVERNR